MTKEAKRLWLGIGAVVILILLLLSKRNGGMSAITNNNYAPGSVQIPAFDLPPRVPINISLPQTPGFPPFDFSMVSGCACGGSSVPYYSPPADYNYTLNQTNYDVSNFSFNQPYYAPVVGQGNASGTPWIQGDPLYVG